MARRAPSSTERRAAFKSPMSSGESSGHDDRSSPAGRPPSIQRQRSDRAVYLSDHQLVDMAIETATRIKWDEILTRDPLQWKRVDVPGGFVVHTKTEQRTFAVRAVGVLSCCVPELVQLLHSPEATKFLVHMEGLYGEEFKDGAFIHSVNLGPMALENSAQQGQLLDVSIKSVIFQDSSRWRPQRERWTFLDTAYRRDDGQAFEKIMTTMAPRDVNVPPLGHIDNQGRSKHFHDITTAFRIEPEESEPEPDSHRSDRSRSWKETRVYFYGAFTPSSRHGFSFPILSSSEDKVMKRRLVAMAKSCDRLASLVRRRRLGAQVLVDRRLVSMILTAPSINCVCCNKIIQVLWIKQCRICGQGVCSECSQKHEREIKVRGSVRIMLESVRVCDWCLDRVDRSDYSELNETSLYGLTVQPNNPDTPVPSTVIKRLLKDQLMHAKSPSRLASVMNIIKCVTETTDETLATAQNQSRRVADLIDALDSIKVPQIPYDVAELSTTHGRPYIVDSSNPDEQMAYPLPHNEDERLRVIAQLGIRDLLNNSDELNIICELAAMEMDTFGSMVTIITADEEQVVATNVEALRNATFPRAGGFCSHTIMDTRPHLVPHPEADVRFHQSGSIKHMGIRYYCGFPIMIDSDIVIGTLCCVNTTTKEMNETQFNTMKKLADTASKVIKLQRRRILSGGSSVASK